MAPKDMEMKDQDDEVKDLPTTSACPEAIEVDYERDHALATTLQEQERAFAMLESTESDEDEDEYEDEDGGGDGDGDESYLPSTDEYFEGGFQFFTSQELADLELLEEEEEEEDEEEEVEEEEELEEDNNTEDEDEEDEDEEEDEMDPDELTYEDLVALGEIAGNENQGLTPEEIIPCLSPYICVSIHSNTGIDKCVICQVEYEEGEGLVSLRCNHPFHDACINQWLQIKKICPICCKEAIKQKTE